MFLSSSNTTAAVCSLRARLTSKAFNLHTDKSSLVRPEVAVAVLLFVVFVSALFSSIRQASQPGQVYSVHPMHLPRAFPRLIVHTPVAAVTAPVAVVVAPAAAVAAPVAVAVVVAVAVAVVFVTAPAPVRVPVTTSDKSTSKLWPCRHSVCASTEKPFGR